MIEVGQPAPGFELLNQSGERVTLEEFQGQRVILYFYPRADTPGCTTEACGFRDRWDEFASRDIVILGVSDDPVEDIRAFKEKYDLPFQLLSDESGTVAENYDSYGEKNMFGRTFDGVYRNTFVIDPEGRIEAIFNDVTPEDHAAELVDAILP